MPSHRPCVQDSFVEQENTNTYFDSDFSDPKPHVLPLLPTVYLEYFLKRREESGLGEVFF